MLPDSTIGNIGRRIRLMNRVGKLGWLLVAAVLAMAAGQAARTGEAAPRGAATVSVAIVEPQLTDPLSWGFDPPTITVAAGDAVQWTNQGTIDHTVLTSDQAFKSDLLHTGDVTQYTFAAPGSYDYVCGLHPTM